MAVGDIIIYLINIANSYLDLASNTVGIILFDYPCTFNTIQYILLKEKLYGMQVGTSISTSWITDHLTSSHGCEWHGGPTGSVLVSLDVRPVLLRFTEALTRHAFGGVYKEWAAIWLWEL